MSPKSDNPKPDDSKPDSRRSRIEAVRAERARQERTEHRRRLLIWGGAGLAALLLVGGGIAAIVETGNSSSPTSASSTAIPAQPRTTADGRTTPPPWDAPANSAAAAAVKAAGLPMLTSEGTAEHIHAHLDVFVDGKAVPVPALIGIDESAQQLSPVHTHDTSGIIHIESPVKSDFSLGQLMTEWQVSLSADHLGGLKTDSTHTLTAYVNGKAVTGDPAAITLGAHDQVTLVYGTASENAQVTVPGSYNFPSGL